MLEVLPTYSCKGRLVAEGTSAVSAALSVVGLLVALNSLSDAKGLLNGVN